jgi:hypothetical protein
MFRRQHVIQSGIVLSSIKGLWSVQVTEAALCQSPGFVAIIEWQYLASQLTNIEFNPRGILDNSPRPK